MNSAEYLVELLSVNDVKTIFMLNGGGMMHLVDAIERNPNITYVHHHHEQCAGIAADAYARVTQRFGVCFATSGPGGSNLTTAIAGAYQDSTPSLFIIGQAKTSDTISGKGIPARQIGTFEIDIIPTLKNISKYAVTISHQDEIPDILEYAITTAKSGRPGPCVVEIPLDIQGAKVPSRLHNISYYKHLSLTSQTDDYESEFFRNLTKDFAKSMRPTLLVGKGVKISKQNNRLKSFAEKHNIPVVTTQFGKDSFDNYNNLFMGHSGPKGTRAGNYTIQNSDLIITLGSSLHGQTIGWEEDLFAPQARIYRVDIDANNLKNTKMFVDHDIQLDIRDFLLKIEKLPPKRKIKCWLEKCTSFRNNNQPENETFLQNTQTVNAYEIVFTINKCYTDDEIFVSDAGTAFYVTGQTLKINSQQDFISSASLGAMGFALPASTGAAIADPNRLVVCITGDGSLMTNLSELSVIKQKCQNVVIIIINNNGYVSMRNTQDAFFEGRRIGEGPNSEVRIPSIKKIAETFGLNFYKANTAEQLETILSDLKNTVGPNLIEVIANNEQEIIPTVKSRKLENGKMISGTLHPMYPFK